MVAMFKTLIVIRVSSCEMSFCDVMWWTKQNCKALDSAKYCLEIIFVFVGKKASSFHVTISSFMLPAHAGY